MLKKTIKSYNWKSFINEPDKADGLRFLHDTCVIMQKKIRIGSCLCDLCLYKETCFRQIHLKIVPALHFVS